MSTATPPRSPMNRRSPSPPRGSSVVAVATTIDPIRVLRRYLLLIIAAAILGAGLGVGLFVYLVQNHSLFAGEVLFEIRSGVRESREVGPNEIMSDDLVFRLASTESIILTDRDILERAMGDRDIRETEWHRQFLIQDESGREVFDVQSAIDDLVESLNANVLRGTNFYRLGWRARRPADVPIVLNRIADVYIAHRREQDRATLRENRELFNNELTEITNEIGTLERAISDFIRSEGITAEDPRFSTIALSARHLTEQVQSTASNLNFAQSALMQTQAKLIGTLEPTSEDVQEAALDPIVRQQASNISGLKTERRHLIETLSASHPSVREIESRVRAAELEYEEMLDEVINRNLQARNKRLSDEIERLNTTLMALQDEADAQEERLSELAAAHAQYRGKQSRLGQLESRREAQLALLNEARLIEVRADAARVRIAQRAFVPRERAFPRLTIVAPLTTLVVLALTLGLIFLREITDQRIKSASDLAVLPGGRVLGVIPDLEEDPTRTKSAELALRKNPNSVIAESYRQACAALTRSIERNGHQTILFLSGLPNAGTTTAITNVAASLAASGRKVLVVDTNFRRPRLAEAMGISASGQGLGDVLVEAASLDEAIVETDDGISVLPAGGPANRIFERLNNDRFETTIAELRGRFDTIIFDAPPAVVAGDAMVLANRVDAAVIVVRANQEQRGLVARLINQLADARCDLIGILLNRPRRTAGGYFKKNYKAMASYTDHSGKSGKSKG